MLDVRFARSGDVSVAYHVVGDGPVDLVYVLGAFNHLEIEWDLPAFRSFCERLGEFTRLIVLDKRGMGMSERVPGATPLEVRMDDIRAVMDAVGSERAAILGESEGGPLAILFAAAHPERTGALILQGAEVRERTDEDWPWGESTPEEFEASMAGLRERWGQGRGFRFLAPSVGDVEWGRAWFGRLQRNSGTPGEGEAFMRMAFEIDVRDVAPSIHVPTLILHAAGDQVCHVENARWLARTIAGARHVELPGADHVPWFEPETVLAEIREFLTGQREAAEPERVLATVVFADVVGSTESAARLGDRRWRDVLASFRTAVGREVDRHRGRVVDWAGDGVLAMFDGPARAIRSARAIADAGRPLDLSVRTGIHTGEVELTDGGIAGIGVHIGARVAGLAAPGEILVSGTVHDLVAGGGLAFSDRGMHLLKGVPGKWRVWSVLAS